MDGTLDQFEDRRIHKGGQWQTKPAGRDGRLTGTSSGRVACCNRSAASFFTARPRNRCGSRVAASGRRGEKRMLRAESRAWLGLLRTRRGGVGQPGAGGAGTTRSAGGSRQ